MLLLTLFQLFAVVVSMDLAVRATALVEECCADEGTETRGSDCTVCADCPDERDGKSCPPACPACHRAHGVLGLPAAMTTVRARPTTRTRALAVSTPAAASRPRAPSIFGVYRPPRSVASPV